MDTPLPKSLKPKHLSFNEMWKLYKTIKDALPEKNEEYLFHEVLKTMEKMTNSNFKDVLLVLYGDGFHNNQPTSKYALMFIDGMKKNNFFSFSSFVKSLSK